MSEHEPPTEVPPMIEEGKAAGKGLSPKSMIAIAAIAVVLVFMIQIWLGNRRAANEKRVMFGHAVDALAAACEPQLLDRSFPSKASAYATKLAQSGQFTLVEFADRSGKIIGSTNRTREGTTPAEMSNPPLQTKIENVSGRLRATRAIVLGGNNVIGSLRIEKSESD